MGGGKVNVQSEIEALTAKLRPSGSGSLLDRFKNVKPPRAQDFAYLHDPDLLHRLTPVVVGEEDDDAPEPVKAKRKRKNAAYAAAKSGQLPSIKFGGKIVVPTARLKRLLGIEDTAA